MRAQPGDTQPVVSHQSGLTLIELLVTLTIAVILLTVGVPSFINMIASNTARSYANDLLADINLARNEAITRGIWVVICKGTATDAGSGCTAGNWEDGWKVFEDCNDNQVMNTATCPDRDLDGNPDDESVLRVHAALSNGWTLRGNGLAPAGVVDFIRFRPDGRATNNGTLVACKEGVLNSGNQPRSSAVVVLGTGRARVAPDSNQDGIPDGVAGCNL